DAEALGGHEVPDLVERDRDDEPDDEDEDADEEAHRVPASSRARCRAQASAAWTVARSRLAAGTPSCSARTCSRMSVMASKLSRPTRKAATHSSLAALRTAGWVAEAAAAWRARRTPRKVSSSSGSKVQLVASSQRHAATARWGRAGQDWASAMGRRMSGGDAWAMVEPSTNSTIEWTTDCGWTTTVMSSTATSKSRWASMSSRPLLTRVAEFTVTTGPIAHVGWTSASAAVTPVSSSRRDRKSVV